MIEIILFVLFIFLIINDFQTICIFIAQSNEINLIDI